MIPLEPVTDTSQPILGPLMRLASTSLQDASKEVLSTYDQYEVRSTFASNVLQETDDNDFLKVFNNPSAVSPPAPRMDVQLKNQNFPASRTQPIRS